MVTTMAGMPATADPRFSASSMVSGETWESSSRNRRLASISLQMKQATSCRYSGWRRMTLMLPTMQYTGLP